MIKFGGGRSKRGIALVGCGAVGKGLCFLLRDKREFLKDKYGFEFELRLICDFVRGTLLSKDGLDLDEVARNLEARGDFHEMPGVTIGALPLEDLLRDVSIDYLCEATPTDYKTGQPSLGILQTALKRGINAVTCSKGGVGRDLNGLKNLARANNVDLRFEGSVLSGTPLIGMVRKNLAGCAIEKVEGVLNGTTNYILSRMEAGLDYDAALKRAQELGYAETDPTGDVEGFDTAVKVAIMAQEFFGVKMTAMDVERIGITGITPEDVAASRAENKRIKLLGTVEKDGNAVRGRVAPRAIEMTNPLAGLMDAQNGVSITTDNLGEVTIIGPGAGMRETAQAFLVDILDIESRR